MVNLNTIPTADQSARSSLLLLSIEIADRASLIGVLLKTDASIVVVREAVSSVRLIRTARARLLAAIDDAYNPAADDQSQPAPADDDQRHEEEDDERFNADFDGWRQ